MSRLPWLALVLLSWLVWLTLVLLLLLSTEACLPAPWAVGNTGWAFVHVGVLFDRQVKSMPIHRRLLP